MQKNTLNSFLRIQIRRITKYDTIQAYAKAYNFLKMLDGVIGM